MYCALGHCHLIALVVVAGNTRGAEKLIAESVLKGGRILIVSNRVTLAHDHISNFNRVVKAAWTARHGTDCPDSRLFLQYNKAMEGTNLAEVPRLVCQAESLGRLQGAKPYQSCAHGREGKHLDAAEQ